MAEVGARRTFHSYFADAPVRHSYLLFIHLHSLGSNAISTKGVAAVAEALQHNKTLTQLLCVSGKDLLCFSAPLCPPL
jgi:hypothetical protein